MAFKTRGLTHRCAFWGLQHLILIFSRIFLQKIRENEGKNRQFQAKKVKHDSRSISESMKPMYVKI